MSVITNGSPPLVVFRLLLEGVPFNTNRGKQQVSSKWKILVGPTQASGARIAMRPPPEVSIALHSSFAAPDVSGANWKLGSASQTQITGRSACLCVCVWVGGGVWVRCVCVCAFFSGAPNLEGSDSYFDTTPDHLSGWGWATRRNQEIILNFVG